jgi:GTP-dependent phosphoenolpyruvate carboxykinase
MRRLEGFRDRKHSRASPAPTKHKKLVAWVESIAALTKPDRVYWCDGSEEEWQRLTNELSPPAR